MFVSVTKFIIAYSWEESDFFHNLLQCFTLLLCTRTILGDMSDGDDSYSLEVGRREEATHDVGVEVAHPAGAEVAFGSSEAQMLGSPRRYRRAACRRSGVSSTRCCSSCTRCKAEQCGTNRGRMPARAVP